MRLFFGALIWVLLATGLWAETPAIRSSELTATWLCKEFSGTREENKRHCALALTEFAHSNSQLAILNTNLGRALADLGQDEAALPLFDKAQSLNPAYEAALRHKGWSLWELDHYEKAAAAFDAAFALSPSANALAGMGSSLWRGRLDEARAAKVFDQALQIQPDYTWVMVEQGWLARRQGEEDTALELFEEVLAMEPDYASATYGRSKIFAARGDWEAALQAANVAVKHRPKDAIYRSWRAQIYRKLERFGRALDDAEEAMKLDPQAEDSIVELGRALIARGDTTKAKEVFAKADAAGDAQNYVLYVFGELLADEYEWEDALEKFDRAVTMDGADERDHNMRAYILINLGRYEEARKAALRALEIDDAMSHAMYNAALSDLELGNLTAAYDMVIRAHEAGLSEDDMSTFIAHLVSDNQYAFALRLRVELNKRKDSAEQSE